MALDPRACSGRCSGGWSDLSAAAAWSRWPATRPSRMTFYFGACAGGVWKTTDGGTYWENVSDGFFQTRRGRRARGRAGRPQRHLRRHGRGCIRGNVSHGDGVYRSTDAGRTWPTSACATRATSPGCASTPAIPTSSTSPRSATRSGPNQERGVFRSTDGGRPGSRSCSASEDAGAVDLTHGPAQPARPLRGVLAGAAHAVGHDQRRSGQSALFKSTDGGDTWTEISPQPGLPRGRARQDRRRRLAGRRPSVSSPWSRPRTARCSAPTTAAPPGSAVSDRARTAQRPWYYMHIFADPRTPTPSGC